MNKITDEQLIEHLKSEVRRVKIQRNEIEQDLFKARKRIRELVWQSNDLFSQLKKLKNTKPNE